MDSFKDNIKNFIENEIDADLGSGKVSEVVTRFPPEPNGYLHIGHAKSICLNFGLARQYGGRCHLRFDDTNPEKEEQEYIDSIKDNVRWLGFDWGEHLYYASDYYDKLYGYAVELIEKGLAYVDDLSADEIREYRGTLTERGKNSPWRGRSVKENLELFGRMKSGDFGEGEKVLRAKIDMGSSNMNMRDPVIYRIKFAEHHRTGAKWCIYPMYDFTHCISDALEGITHSICTLEFEDHRPLYDWVLDNVSVPCHPRQIEFARLNLTHTMMSKRKLLRLVDEGHVSGWDDPRMPTLAGIRRRGYTPAAVREFAKAVGVAKSNSLVDFAMLEYFVRDDLNMTASRVMVVLDPLKVTIENYPEGKSEWLKAENNPNDPHAGEREIPFSREIYIEREDFMETPSKKFFRLAPGREVRLKHGYYITCTDVLKDDKGNVTELICRYDAESKGGWTADERKVKGTLHWVSAAHAVSGEVRLYGHLFADDVPGDSAEGGDFTDSIDPGSLTVIENALMEPGLSEAAPGDKFQFLRKGYFCADPDTLPGRPVFNRIVGLKDSWAKLNA